MCQWSAFKSDADAKPNFLFDDETVNLVTGINYVSTRAALVDPPSTPDRLGTRSFCHKMRLFMTQMKYNGRSLMIFLQPRKRFFTAANYSYVSSPFHCEEDD
jgi:hypothetical protein